MEQRLAGLLDEPRVGAPRKISDKQIEKIVVKTLETTPKARTHWSTRKMAKEAGVTIYDYVEAHNDEGISYRWVKSADEIIHSVGRFAKRTLQLHPRG